MGYQGYQILEYKNEYYGQIVELFNDFQDYLVELDPLQRLRRLEGYGEKALERTLKEINDNEGKFLIAVDLDKVIGFIVGIIEKQTDQDLLGVVPSTPGRITELYISPKYRGKGIGSELMNKIERYFKDKGRTVAKVEVFAPNETARNLYKKLGYEARDIDNIKNLT